MNNLNFNTLLLVLSIHILKV